MGIISVILIYMKRMHLGIDDRFSQSVIYALFVLSVAKFMDFYAFYSGSASFLSLLSNIILLMAVVLLLKSLYVLISAYRHLYFHTSRKPQENRHHEDLYSLIQELMTEMALSVQNLIPPRSLNRLLVKHIDIVGLKRDDYFDDQGSFLIDKIIDRIEAEPRERRVEYAIMICNYFLNEFHIFLANIVGDRALETIEGVIKRVFDNYPHLVEKQQWRNDFSNSCPTFARSAISSRFQRLLPPG